MRFVQVCAAAGLMASQSIAAADQITAATDSTAEQFERLTSYKSRFAAPDVEAMPGRTESGPHVDVVAINLEQGVAPPFYSSRDLCRAILAAAEAHDLPANFFVRLIWQESGFKTRLVSRAGAQGIAQFMPDAASEMGIDDPFDPEQALPASAKFLKVLYKEFGNHGLAAAAYNAGRGRVRSWLKKKSKLPGETRAYVYNITGKKAEHWVGSKEAFADIKPPPGAHCEDGAPAVTTAQAAR